MNFCRFYHVKQDMYIIAALKVQYSIKAFYFSIFRLILPRAFWQKVNFHLETSSNFFLYASIIFNFSRSRFFFISFTVCLSIALQLTRDNSVITIFYEKIVSENWNSGGRLCQHFIFSVHFCPFLGLKLSHSAQFYITWEKTLL